MALTILLGAIVKLDGFILHLADLRIRMRTPWRVLFWLATVLILRTILFRRSPPFGLRPAAAAQSPQASPVVTLRVTWLGGLLLRLLF